MSRLHPSLCFQFFALTMKCHPWSEVVIENSSNDMVFNNGWSFDPEHILNEGKYWLKITKKYFFSTFEFWDESMQYCCSSVLESYFPFPHEDTPCLSEPVWVACSLFGYCHQTVNTTIGDTGVVISDHHRVAVNQCQQSLLFRSQSQQRATEARHMGDTIQS